MAEELPALDSIVSCPLCKYDQQQHAERQERRLCYAPVRVMLQELPPADWYRFSKLIDISESEVRVVKSCRRCGHWWPELGKINIEAARARSKE